MRSSLKFMRAAKRAIVYAATSVILETTFKSGGYKNNERGMTEVDSHENQAETRRCGYAAIFSRMKYPQCVLEPCDPHTCKVAVRSNATYALLVIGAKHTEEPKAYFQAIGPAGMDVVHYQHDDGIFDTTQAATGAKLGHTVYRHDFDEAHLTLLRNY